MKHKWFWFLKMHIYNVIFWNRTQQIQTIHRLCMQKILWKKISQDITSLYVVDCVVELSFGLWLMYIDNQTIIFCKFWIIIIGRLNMKLQIKISLVIWPHCLIRSFLCIFTWTRCNGLNRTCYLWFMDWTTILGISWIAQFDDFGCSFWHFSSKCFESSRSIT